MSTLLLFEKLYIPKLSCICWHTGVKIVQQIMQEKVILRSQVTQSHATRN